MGKFIGVVVLPEHRMKRVGSTLMQNVLKEVRKAGLKSLRVYTMAYLDRLAPGAVLYLKSGGRITAEYLQLEK
jgi:GNAT superfamily N-acetyltransferase